MKEEINNNKYVREFDSISEFYNYIIDMPINSVFKSFKFLESNKNSFDFTATNNFNEAVQLLKNGWNEKSEIIEQALKASKNDMQPALKSKPVYNIQGYQASVPRFLQGIPTNMVDTKKYPVKNKIVTLDKSISYAGYWNTSNMLNESVKALQIINKFENMGYRCNINIIFGVKDSYSSHMEILKIKIKSANERLNISKTAFPLAHPSMLRRLIFRYIETAPTINSGFVHGYGSPIKADGLKQMIKNEYIIPEEIKTPINEITNLENLV